MKRGKESRINESETPFLRCPILVQNKRHLFNRKRKKSLVKLCLNLKV